MSSSSSSAYLPHVDNHRLLRRRTHGYTTRLRLDFGAVVRARHGHHHLVGLSRHLPIYLPAYLSDHLPVEEEEEEVPGLAGQGRMCFLLLLFTYTIFIQNTNKLVLFINIHKVERRRRRRYWKTDHRISRGSGIKLRSIEGE